MATAPTLPAVSEEEYLRTDYEPNCEYLDGVLVPKALSDETHSRLQAILAAYFIAVEQKYGFRVVTEIHTRICPKRWRIPDLAVLAGEKTGRRYPDSDAPPVLTIEIVSLDEPWSELYGKITDHLAVGVQTAIIVDPYKKTVFVARPNQPLHEIAPPLVVSVSIPGKDDLVIDFDALFAQI